MYDVNQILAELNINHFECISEIAEGADSSVWKVQTKDSVFALRVLPNNRLDQFLSEEQVLTYASQNRIPVPKVYKVAAGGNWSAMLMEWSNGITVLHALRQDPEKAGVLGFSFGEMQATIHQCLGMTFRLRRQKDFLTPITIEENVVHKHILAKSSLEERALLHLDYHPLNVLTDGKSITSVIDWANASTGDARFDYARTKAILELEGTRACEMAGIDPDVWNRFKLGWERGYEATSGNMDPVPMFYAWAGYRMIRDLKGKRNNEELLHIQQWAESWKGIGE